MEGKRGTRGGEIANQRLQLIKGSLVFSKGLHTKDSNSPFKDLINLHRPDRLHCNITQKGPVSFAPHSLFRSPFSRATSFRTASPVLPPISCRHRDCRSAVASFTLSIVTLRSGGSICVHMLRSPASRPPQHTLSRSARSLSAAHARVCASAERRSASATALRVCTEPQAHTLARSRTDVPSHEQHIIALPTTLSAPPTTARTEFHRNRLCGARAYAD